MGNEFNSTQLNSTQKNTPEINKQLFQVSITQSFLVFGSCRVKVKIVTRPESCQLSVEYVGFSNIAYNFWAQNDIVAISLTEINLAATWSLNTNENYHLHQVLFLALFLLQLMCCLFLLPFSLQFLPFHSFKKKPTVDI